MKATSHVSQLKKLISSASLRNTINPFARFQAFREANNAIINPDIFSPDKVRHPFRLDLEPSTFPGELSSIADDVLEFCLQTDICQKLGVSFFEIMSVDPYSFQKIREKYNLAGDEKKRIIDELNHEAAVKKDTQKNKPDRRNR